MRASRARLFDTGKSSEREYLSAQPFHCHPHCLEEHCSTSNRGANDHFSILDRYAGPEHNGHAPEGCCENCTKHRHEAQLTAWSTPVGKTKADGGLLDVSVPDIQKLIGARKRGGLRFLKLK